MANQDSTSTIYNGLHTVKFSNGNHRYYVDDELKPGVTTIMGKIIAKPELMLWPLNMAMRYLEPKIPTITAQDLADAQKAHVKRRDAGADTGTIVHKIVEDVLLGKDTSTTDQSHEVNLAVNAFRNWKTAKCPKTVAVEQVVYSHLHKFAGTFDSILEIDGKVYLCDLKTTNASRTAPKGVYAENFIQLGAYYYAYEEQRHYEMAHGGTNLVKIDDLLVISCRKDGKVDTLSASDLGLNLKTCMKMWESTLFLHNSLLGVKKKLETA